eukprot:scaffold233_cov174-Ochromonas_danica.AAC.51
MKKIKPVYEDIAFDSLDTLSGPSSNSSNRRKNGKIIPLSDDTAITAGKVRKKPQGGLAPGKDHVTSYISNKSYRHQILIWNHIKDFTCSMKSLRLGAPFVVLAIIFGGILEMYSLSQRYNFTIILALSAAMKFPNFPSQSVRPQLCLSVVTLLSFAADGVRWLWRRQKAWLIRQKLKRRQESVEEEKSDDSELDDFHLRPAFLQEGEGESNDPRAISLNGFDQTIDKEVEKEGFEGRYAETDPLLGVEHKADDILDEVVVNMMTEKEDKLEVEEVTRSSEVVLSDQTLLQMRKNEEQSLYREEQRRRREEHEDTAALGFDVLDPPRPHNRHQSRPRYRTDRKGPAHVYYRITMDEETSNPLRERKDSRQKGVETKPDAHNSIDSEDSEELPLDGDGSFTYNYRDRRGRSTARVTKFV